jgi:flagellar basal body-associated protein FliL
MPNYTDHSPPTSDKAPKIALTVAAVVALLVVTGVFFRLNNSEQSRPVNPANTHTLGDDNTRQ